MADKFKTVDEYINSFDGETKKRLVEVRKLAKEQLPASVERISYNIPAYFINKKLIIYFAGYDKHIGVYPGRTGDKSITEGLKEYASGKSTLKFPHDKPLPKELIKKYINNRKED